MANGALNADQLAAWALEQLPESEPVAYETLVEQFTQAGRRDALLALRRLKAQGKVRFSLSFDAEGNRSHTVSRVQQG